MRLYHELTTQVSERRRIKFSEELILLRLVSYLEEVSMELKDGFYEEISSLCSEGDQLVDEKTA